MTVVNSNALEKIVWARQRNCSNWKSLFVSMLQLVQSLIYQDFFVFADLYTWIWISGVAVLLFVSVVLVSTLCFLARSRRVINVPGSRV